MAIEAREALVFMVPRLAQRRRCRISRGTDRDADAAWLNAERGLGRAEGTTKTWTDEELEALALGVSREAVLRRLVALCKTTQTFYKNRRALLLKEHGELNEAKSEGWSAVPPFKY